MRRLGVVEVRGEARPLAAHHTQIRDESAIDARTPAIERLDLLVVQISSSPKPRVAPGTRFLSPHFPETHANQLTGPHVDPLSKCPDYEVTAVRFV